MNKVFLQDFQNITNENIFEFVNNWTYHTYNRQFLRKNIKNYKIDYIQDDCYGVYRVEYDSPMSFQPEVNKEVISLGAFNVIASDCNQDELTLAWRKYLNTNCKEYSKAFKEKIDERLNEMKRKSAEEINEFSQ